MSASVNSRYSGLSRAIAASAAIAIAWVLPSHPVGSFVHRHHLQSPACAFARARITAPVPSVRPVIHRNYPQILHSPGQSATPGTRPTFASSFRAGTITTTRGDPTGSRSYSASSRFGTRRMPHAASTSLPTQASAIPHATTEFPGSSQSHPATPPQTHAKAASHTAPPQKRSPKPAAAQSTSTPAPPPGSTGH